MRELDDRDSMYIDCMEETMDYLIRCIRKYSSCTLNDIEMRSLVRVKRRYYRYEAEHRKITGSYYKIDQVSRE